MPSKPILISVTASTPASAQAARSDSLIGREALAMSGCSTPIPPQNSLKPPPVPVDSMTGVWRPEAAPKRSATVVAKG